MYRNSIIQLSDRAIKVRRGSVIEISTKAIFGLLFSAGLLTSCGGGSSSMNDAESVVGDGSADNDDSQVFVPVSAFELAKFNQIGFYPESEKIAVISNAQEDQFLLLDENGSEVFSGGLGSELNWVASAEQVKIADFSAFNTPGEYQIQVGNVIDTDLIKIQQNAFSELHLAALKYYYFSRSSFALDETYAGVWAREAGQLDTEVLVHSSAASEARPEGTVISASKGWYDAGDFNKYIVNSGITTYSLLAAYEHYPEYFAIEHDGFIPESGNGLPDILDEALWNIRWMLAMQDPNDGGVYHKLTAKNFQGVIMPAEANVDRYVVQKTTAATLDFAAVMAVTSRIFSDQAERLNAINEPFSTELSELAIDALQAAKDAWEWAVASPNVPYQQPEDITTGQYGDSVFSDEFAWAAAELFITTDEQSYFNDYMSYRSGVGVPGFAYVEALPLISLIYHRDSFESSISDQVINQLTPSLKSLSDSFVVKQSQSAYDIAYGEDLGDFVWGGNAVALNQSLVLLAAYEFFDDQDYLNTALANMDYVLGRNPLEISYVTGTGARSPMFPHHRASAADEIEEPIPGMLAGGAQPGQQDGCAYESSIHALSYIDDFCSYSTNEIAINWNASLVYVSAALDQYLGEQ